MLAGLLTKGWVFLLSKAGRCAEQVTIRMMGWWCYTIWKGLPKWDTDAVSDGISVVCILWFGLVLDCFESALSGTDQKASAELQLKSCDGGLCLVTSKHRSVKNELGFCKPFWLNGGKVDAVRKRHLAGPHCE